MDITIPSFVILSLSLAGTHVEMITQRDDTFFSTGPVDEATLANVHASDFSSPSSLVCCMECGRDVMNCKGTIFKQAVKRCLILHELPQTLQGTLNQPVYKVLAKHRDFSKQQVAIVFLDLHIYTLNLDTRQWTKLFIVGWLYNTVSFSVFFEDYVYFVVNSVYKFKFDSANMDFISVTEVHRPKHKDRREAINGVTFDKDTREMFITVSHAVLAVDIYNKTDIIITNVSVQISKDHDIVHVSKTRRLFFGAKSSLHMCTYEGKQIRNRKVYGPWSLTVDIKGNRILWSGFNELYEMDLVELTPRYLSRSEGIPVIVLLPNSQFLLVGYGKTKQRRIVTLSRNGTLNEQRQFGLIPECKECRVRGTRLISLQTSLSNPHTEVEDKRTNVIVISMKGMYMLNVGTKIFRKISVCGYNYRMANGVVLVNGTLYIADNTIHRGTLWRNETDAIYTVQDQFAVKSKHYWSSLFGLTIDAEAGLIFCLGPAAVYSVSIETRVDTVILQIKLKIEIGSGIVNFGSKRLLYFTAVKSLRSCSYVGERAKKIAMLSEKPLGLTADETENRLLWTTAFLGNIYSLDLQSFHYHIIGRMVDARVPPILRSLTGGSFIVAGYKGTVMLYSKDGKPTAKLGDIPECNNCRIRAATVVNYAME